MIFNVSFRQILQTTALEILEIRQVFLWLSALLSTTFARKPTHKSCEDRFLISITAAGYSPQNLGIA